MAICPAELGVPPATLFSPYLWHLWFKVEIDLSGVRPGGLLLPSVLVQVSTHLPTHSIWLPLSPHPAHSFELGPGKRKRLLGAGPACSAL